MATRSWNRVELIGNLTKDPELRYTPQGSAVATFSIATNRIFVTDGEKREEADFHRVVAWNKLAELCSQLLKKGNRVFVSGRLQNRSWEDQTSGQTRQITEIVLEDMILLTNKGESGGSYDDTPVPDEDSAPAKPPKAVEEAIENETPKSKDSTEEKITREPVKEEKIEEEELDDLPF